MHSETIGLSVGTIHYRTAGSGDNAIILIHGNSQSAAGFDGLMSEMLARNFRMIAPDLPGHGDSSWAEDPDSVYNFQGFAAVLIEFAWKLGLKGAVWAGFSLGGHILMTAWKSLPEPAGMFLCGTSPLSGGEDVGPAYGSVPELRLMFAPHTDRETADRAARLIAGPGREPDPFVVEDYLRTDPAVRAGIGAMIVSGTLPHDETMLLEDSEVPVAVSFGALDITTNPDYLGRLRSGRYWRNRIVNVPDTGHNVYRDDPVKFRSILEEFCNDIFG